MPNVQLGSQRVLCHPAIGIRSNATSDLHPSAGYRHVLVSAFSAPPYFFYPFANLASASFVHFSPAATEYPSYGYSNPNSQSQSHIHVVSPSPRVENGQRKRPKYTRSKTGCMTCRGKKIKVRRARSLFYRFCLSASRLG